MATPEAALDKSAFAKAEQPEHHTAELSELGTERGGDDLDQRAAEIYGKMADTGSRIKEKVGGFFKKIMMRGIKETIQGARDIKGDFAQAKKNVSHDAAAVGYFAHGVKEGARITACQGVEKIGGLKEEALKFGSDIKSDLSDVYENYKADLGSARDKVVGVVTRTRDGMNSAAEKAGGLFTRALDRINQYQTEGAKRAQETNERMRVEAVLRSQQNVIKATAEYNRLAQQGNHARAEVVFSASPA